METFSCKTKILCGRGACSALAGRGIRRLFVVTDPYFYKNGMAQRVADLAGAEATDFFQDITPDPSLELAAKGTAKLKAFAPDAVLALGGGSAMDCAKAMVYFADCGAKLIAVPTTSGSGSEVTNFSILTHNGVKHPLVDRRLQPELAILDDELLQSLPPKLIADTGFDVLAHALEAVVAKNAGAISDALALDAFGTAFALLPGSFAGQKHTRLPMHRASAMAGMAFSQAGLGLCHAVAHALGGAFHIPHGRLNAILLPAVIDCNAHAAGEKYARAAAAAGLGASSRTMAVRNLKNGLLRLRRELGLPQTLVEAGVNPGEVWRRTDEIVKAALADPCCATNPMTVEAFMVRRVLEAVTGHG